MKIKQINEALRRVEVPYIGPAARESFTAGVRAMAYALEVDTTNENVLKTALEYYADPSIYVTGDAPGHIYAIADDGATARQALQTRGEPAFAKAVQVGNTDTPSWAKQAEPTFAQQITGMIAKAFDNEQAFLAKFLPGNATALDSFNMAGTFCRVTYQFRGVRAAITTAIKTADFIEWTKTLRGAK